MLTLRRIFSAMNAYEDTSSEGLDKHFVKCWIKSSTALTIFFLTNRNLYQTLIETLMFNNCNICFAFAESKVHGTHTVVMQASFITCECLRESADLRALAKDSNLSTPTWLLNWISCMDNAKKL